MKPSRIPVRANLLPRQRILNDKILGITREPTARIREEGFAPHTSAVLAVSINRFRATGKNHKALFSLSGLLRFGGCRPALEFRCSIEFRLGAVQGFHFF